MDDDPNDLRYIRDTLVQAGYAAVVSGDPAEALGLMAATAWSISRTGRGKAVRESVQ